MTRYTCTVSYRDASTEDAARTAAKTAGWQSDAGTVAERIYTARQHREKVAAGLFSVERRRGYWLAVLEVRP